MKTQTKIPTVIQFIALVICLLFAGVRTHAANQTWTNAPVSSYWSNTVNWVSNGIPGATNSSTTADVATFLSPIPLSGIGGVTMPITNDFQRGIRSILFDTVDCGAYVFGNDPINNYALEIIHLGNITMNPAVTNPICFVEALRFRIPNSTNGRYDLTNNAASPTATFYVNTISNTSANTRPLNMFLGGSNTGTNTIARFDDIAAGAGAIVLDKVGTGTWILSGPNDLPQKTSASVVAHVFVNEGLLIVKDAGSLGTLTAPNVLVTNTGVLQIDGVTLNNPGITIRSGGTVRMNGSGTINGVTIGNQVGVVANLLTTSASDVLTNGGGIGVINGGAADSVLHLGGPGTILINVLSTYAGRWSFDSGVVQISTTGGLGTGPNANIAGGAILDITPMGSTVFSLSTGGLSASGAGTGVGSTAATISMDPTSTFDAGSKPISLTFTPTAFAGDTTHPSLYVASGTLSLNGNAFTVNNASGTPLGVGTYRLIQQATGNITVSGAPVVIVTGSGLAPGTVGEIIASGGNLNMSVFTYTPKSLVWKGGNPDNVWDRQITPNWLNGATPSTFNLYDAVLFDATGIAFSGVNVSATMVPSSVKVDTSAGDYTFAGAGMIAGAANLLKVSAGTVIMQTINSYSGGTVVSNGTFRLAVDNAIPSVGAGDLAVYSPGVVDLNTFNDTINALNGNGTIDTISGSAPILTVGNNGNSGTFTGIIKNTTGTVALTKVGNGQQTLTSSNSYSGATTINAGTLRVDNPNALGAGASPVTINAGTLQISTNVNILSLAGTGGSIGNAAGSVTNTVTITADGAYDGVIGNGAAGVVRLVVKSGTTRLNGISTFTGGTVVASGATLATGVIAPNSGTPGAGAITASNGAAITLPTAVSVAGVLPNAVNAVDGATVTFTSASQGNSFNSQFSGSAANTNIFTGPGSIGGAYSFSNFLGHVVISNGASVRMFVGANGLAGGDNTTFDLYGTLFSRDASFIRLGMLTGNGNITGPSVTPLASFWIGAKGVDSVFSGGISGSNNIVKSGTGRLTLDGFTSVTNTDNFSYTNVLVNDSVITYIGTTTISNGVLALVVPNTLTNSSFITLAAPTAVLDATQMGYISNQFDETFFPPAPTNTIALVPDGVFSLISTQTLGGIGSLLATTVHAESTTTIAPGLASNVFGNLIIYGTFVSDGAVNLRLGHTPFSTTSDKLTSTNMTLNGTINVTTTVSNLFTGDLFTLFSGPVNGPATNAVTLPTTNYNGSITYVWTNKLAIDGTIKLLSGATPFNTNAPPISFTTTSSNMTVSWPADQIGFRLQAQTNLLTVGLSNNWATVTNSVSTNSMAFPIAITNRAVFFRLIYP